MRPLADTLRPTTLTDYIGQTHLVGKGKPLSTALYLGHIFSIIFWGPPGVGKTTLARIIAEESDREFIELSAVAAGKKDIKAVVDAQHKQKSLNQSYQSPILFIDEIHRFNKAQQDFLLPFVEDGTIILIGATTENPSFEIISALLSRTKVFVLKPLTEKEITQLISRAMKELGLRTQSLNSETTEWLINYASGDGRRLLNLLDTTFNIYQNLKLESLKTTLQSSGIRYDKKGEEHYNTISAFIKSMRASNVDATLYYLARMVEAGEDPKFIARRMVVFASEDIGLAAPTALVVANAVFEAVQNVGYPEAQINLAHGASYLANCKKDRSAYNAYFTALKDVQKYGNLEIPLEIRNAPTQLMKDLKYGQGYQMYPDKTKSLLPKKIKDRKYLSNEQRKKSSS